MDLRDLKAVKTLDGPEASWSALIPSRRAVLWISRNLIAKGLESDPATVALLARLLLHPWAAIYVDSSRLPVEIIRDTNPEVRGHPLRVYTENPTASPPQNRIPIYVLPGSSSIDSEGDSGSSKDTLSRLLMLQRAPGGAETFVLGAKTKADFASIAAARDLSDTFSRLNVVAPELPTDLPVVFQQLHHWPAASDLFADFLDSISRIDHEVEQLLIRVRSGEAYKAVPLHTSIDKSDPITASFELIPLRALLDAAPGSLDDLRAFLTDPATGWHAYGAGIPFTRHEEHRRELLAVLNRVGREGATATITVWLTSEDGAGATTSLRHLAFELAKLGWPVLVARKDVMKFGFHQLSTFLTRAGERFDGEGISSADTPWVIAFDAQHTQLQWEFITGLAAGLKRLQRPAVVIAVRPFSDRTDDARRSALGANKFLPSPLRNSISVAEAATLGEHLNHFLPQELRRTSADWAGLVSETLRRTPEGSRSLFWVALRFWLLQVPGTDQPIHVWLRHHIRTITEGHSELLASILEIAALAKHRLAMPRELLTKDAAVGLRNIAFSGSNLLGLFALQEQIRTYYSLAHPLIADELLRLASKDDDALKAVAKETCVNAFDLELHLFDRLLSREAISSPAGIDLVEELVTSALRVDPRESPRNFAQRDRIVLMLEKVADQVWDDSQIFNHQLAKARRHLAVEPIDSTWTVAALREQLQLAEGHLLDAIENIRPDDENRRESPLNLRVSLALTYDARTKLESRAGDEQVATKYRSAAERAYQAAARIDADNSYVLENFARFKLNQLSRHSDGDERLTHIVDAIALLEWEWHIDHGGRREEPILWELANAYDALETGDGRSFIRDLAARGSEAALVALAKLSTKIVEANAPPDDRALEEAEMLLREVPPENVSSRSAFALYQVVSARRPFDFTGRQELLDFLDGDPVFAWPAQAQLEYGILLFQTGETSGRRKGETVFRAIRDHLAERSGAIGIPDELRFLADPQKEFRTKLRTAFTIRNIGDGGRNYFGVPLGWGTVAVPARVHDFGPGLRPGTERDCFIRFTNFGPQAVPSTFE